MSLVPQKNFLLPYNPPNKSKEEFAAAGSIALHTKLTKLSILAVMALRTRPARVSDVLLLKLTKYIGSAVILTPSFVNFKTHVPYYHIICNLRKKFAVRVHR